MKHLFNKSLSFFMISALFLGSMPAMEAKVDIKELVKKFDFLGNAYKKYGDAQKAYNECIADICQEEGKAADAAWIKAHRSGTYSPFATPPEYEKAIEIYNKCLMRHCGDKDAALYRARKVYSSSLGFFTAALTTAFLTALAGAALTAAFIEKRAPGKRIIAKYEKKGAVFDKTEKDFLYKFASINPSSRENKDTALQEYQQKHQQITPSFSKAIAEIYYGQDNHRVDELVKKFDFSIKELK